MMCSSSTMGRMFVVKSLTSHSGSYRHPTTATSFLPLMLTLLGSPCGPILGRVPDPQRRLTRLVPGFGKLSGMPHGQSTAEDPRTEGPVEVLLVGLADVGVDEAAPQAECGHGQVHLSDDRPGVQVGHVGDLVPGLVR